MSSKVETTEIIKLVLGVVAVGALVIGIVGVLISRPDPLPELQDDLAEQQQSFEDQTRLVDENNRLAQQAIEERHESQVKRIKAEKRSFSGSPDELFLSLARARAAAEAVRPRQP